MLKPNKFAYIIFEFISLADKNNHSESIDLLKASLMVPKRAAVAHQNFRIHIVTIVAQLWVAIGAISSAFYLVILAFNI